MHTRQTTNVFVAIFAVCLVEYPAVTCSPSLDAEVSRHYNRDSDAGVPCFPYKINMKDFLDFHKSHAAGVFVLFPAHGIPLQLLARHACVHNPFGRCMQQAQGC